MPVSSATPLIRALFTAAPGATIALNGGSFTTSSSKTAVELENGGRLTVKEGASITVSGDAEASDVFKFNGTGSLTMDEGFKAGRFHCF